MLIRLTESCEMECSHCLASARPGGAHMAVKTFAQALVFGRVDPFLLLSGGEPTDHPDFVEFVEQAQVFYPSISVLSNGLFLYNRQRKKKYKKLRVHWQITNDPRYYPRRVPIERDSRFVYEHHINTLLPIGRSTEEFGRKAPGCFNLRSVVGVFKSFPDSVAFLRERGIFCTPSIDVNGTLRAGETPECFAFGTIWDSEATLVEQLLDHDCDRCGLHRKLSPKHLGALSR